MGTREVVMIVAVAAVMLSLIRLGWRAVTPHLPDVLPEVRLRLADPLLSEWFAAARRGGKS